MSDLYFKASSSSVSGWQRPEWWAPRPVDFESTEGIYYLVELFEDTKQYLFWNSGSNTDIYFDNVLHTSTTGGVGTYITIDDSFGFDYNGRRFTWVYFDIDGTYPWIELSNDDYVNNPNATWILNTLEILINKDLNYFRQTEAGLTYGIKMFTRNMWFKSNINILNAQFLFANTDLENIENFPTLNGSAAATFRNCNMYAMPVILDFTNVSSVNQTFFGNNNRKSSAFTIINFGNVGGVPNFIAYNRGIMSIEIDDCSGITNFTSSFFRCINLQKLILTDLAVSFNISHCYSLTKQSILDMIDSLTDLSSTTTQNISMVGTPFNEDTDVVNAATSKNWTILS